MPKRVASCIESSVVHHRKTPHICARRNLHTAFWQHGGITTALPLWWDAMVLPFSQSFSRQSLYGKLSIDLRGRTENAILEFLYPPHTLALFKKLSTYRLDRLARRATRLSSRLFSSTSIHNGNVKLGLRVSDFGDTGNAIKV